MLTGTQARDAKPRAKQYELSCDALPQEPSAAFYKAGAPKTVVPLDTSVDDLLYLVGVRNFDLYEVTNGTLSPR